MRSKTETIKTERLALRRFNSEDAARLAKFAGDFDVAKMTASVPHPYPVLAAEGWIMLTEAGRPRGQNLPFAITLPGEGLIGAGGFARDSDGAWEFGYWIGKPFWGKGFATEAAKALVGWWDGAIAAPKLLAGRFADNPASGRVLEKAGFRPTGETAERFSLARLARAPFLEYVRRPARSADWGDDFRAAAL